MDNEEYDNEVYDYEDCQDERIEQMWNDSGYHMSEEEQQENNLFNNGCSSNDNYYSNQREPWNDVPEADPKITKICIIGTICAIIVYILIFF